MAIYTGLVIGGPHDRKIISCKAPILRFAVYPEVIMARKETDYTKPQEIRELKYQHTQLYVGDRTEGAIKGFWVPVEEEDPVLYVLDCLSNFYIKYPDEAQS